MTELQQHSQRVREILRLAVARAMETKRRMGQYAVVFRDGKPVQLPPDQLKTPEDR